MKRIYYLLLAMITATLMAGCSDNDDVIIDPDPVDGEETLFFSIGVNDGIKTKAAGEVVGNEDKIYNLTVLLFNSDVDEYKEEGTVGNYVYGDRVTDEAGALNFIGDIEVSPGVYDIILIANSDIDYRSVSGLTLDKLNENVDEITTQTSNNILMVSELYSNVALAYKQSETTGLYERTTYCYMLNGTSTTRDYNAKQNYNNVYDEDEPVVLTRLASRIQLESIAVDFTENLEGASFQLDKVYLVNARPGTLLIPDAEGKYEVAPTGDTKYYRGAPEGAFDKFYGMISPDPAASAVKAASFAATYGETYTKTDGDKFTFTSEGDMFQKYVFENHKEYIYNEVDKELYDTRLVIEGVITLKEGQVLDKSYYHIPIQKTDDEGKSVFRVVRNNIYAINVTLTGYGHKNPDGTPDVEDDPKSNAKFDVSINVLPWNIINQFEED